MVREHARLFLGGKPGFRGGDVIEPRHRRRPDGRVYVTPIRLYAKHYAHVWGHGDLYRVEPVGDLEISTVDPIESFHTPAVRVAAVLDRAVLLTNSERRRLRRVWTSAERLRVAGEVS